MRYDPYTGEPIPEENDANSNQPLNGNENGFSNDYTSVNPEENSFSSGKSSDVFAPDNSGMANDSSAWNEEPSSSMNNSSYDDSYNAGNDNMYHTNDPQYIPNQQQGYNNPSYSNTPASDNQQYNPYTGQPMNSAGYAYNQNNDDEINRKASIYSVVSLVCGIASILFSFASFCCCPFISIILSIASIIFWAIGKDTYGKRNGLATGGLITSIIGILLTILFVIIFFTFMGKSDSFYNELQKEFNSQNSQNQYDYEYDNDTFNYDDFYR